MELRLKDILEDQVDDKYYLSQITIESYLKHRERQIEKGNGFMFSPVERESNNSKNDNDEIGIEEYGQLYCRGRLVSNFRYEEDPKMTDKIIKVGDLSSSQDGVVVDERGISPTHTAGHGNCPKVLTRGGGTTWQ